MNGDNSSTTWRQSEGVASPSVRRTGSCILSSPCLRCDLLISACSYCRRSAGERAVISLRDAPMPAAVEARWNVDAPATTRCVIAVPRCKLCSIIPVLKVPVCVRIRAKRSHARLPAATQSEFSNPTYCTIHTVSYHTTVQYMEKYVKYPLS